MEIQNNREIENSVELSIVMPCLNEAETVGICIQKAQQWIAENHTTAEIIVADNGSADGSQAIISQKGVCLVNVSEKGYGNAIMGGIEAAKGTFVIVGDSDDSYDFTSLTLFITKLRLGYDLVIGNRFKGYVKPGAMPFLHKYVGNPMLSGIGKLFFKTPCSDFHCGLRGFRKSSILKLNLRTTGMEFASEMVVKAVLYGLSITEVPVVLSTDGRNRPSHLRRWRDGWRHLRFLLLYSPRWLFFYPGLALMIIGLGVSLWLIRGERTVEGIVFDVHTLLYGAMAIVIGFQAVIFALFTKVFVMSEGLVPENEHINKIFRHLTLEVGLIIGIPLVAIGFLGSLYATSSWSARAFGTLSTSQMMRIVIPAVTSLVLGCQIILSSFFLTVLRLKRR